MNLLQDRLLKSVAVWLVTDVRGADQMTKAMRNIGGKHYGRSDRHYIGKRRSR